MASSKIDFNLKSKRQLLLIGIAISLVVGLFLMAPIAQDLSYHQFADTQTLFGIPNFWNVISNLPFVFVGMIGLSALLKKQVTGMLRPLNTIYMIFFVGLIITALGSSYYHWSPNNVTLVWDRLPMTISFIAFFSIVLGENISVKLSKRLFSLLLLIGIASVIYWKITESNGVGDLRPYVLVQFLPVIMIPLILWLYPSPFNGQRYIVMVLVAYVFAKLLEYFDHQVLELLGFMSGHPIKHVAAAIGTYYLYLALKHRSLGEAK